MKKTTPQVRLEQLNGLFVISNDNMANQPK